MSTSSGVDPAGLRIGGRYRVDRKHERLRRTFRFIGTLIAIEAIEAAESDGHEMHRLTFEIRPRFGKPTLQTFDLDSLVAVVPT